MTGHRHLPRGTQVARWETSELKDVIEKLYGRSYLQQHCEPYIDSFWDKAHAAWLNRDEALHLMRELIPEHRQPGLEYLAAFDYHFKIFGDREKGAELDYQKRHIETHVLAYAYSLYSMSDVLAQVIVSSLMLRGKLGEEGVYLGSVSAAAADDKELKRLVRKINKLFNLDSFKYLKALVNTDKHSHHVKIPYSFMAVATADDTSHGMKIGRFTKGGKHFVEKWAAQFVEEDLVVIFNSYLEIGNEVNRVLAPRTALLN